MSERMIGGQILLGFVPCPECKQECGIFKGGKSGKPYYQHHRIKSRTIPGSDTHMCRKGGVRASAIDVLALLGGES